MLMNTPLEELMWDAHRAESNMALTHDFKGEITDARAEELIFIPYTEPEDPDCTEIHVHNMGVARGVEALLDQLQERGYTLLDPLGRKVDKGPHKSFGDAWRAWHKKTPPRLRVVK